MCSFVLICMTLQADEMRYGVVLRVSLLDVSSWHWDGWEEEVKMGVLEEGDDEKRTRIG